ncbi:MAG: HAD hydrolase-like protein, partial [Planctomycetes bacterium]|nr:HAD hydrolase-like protein [Planctomycetota bacterium]
GNVDLNGDSNIENWERFHQLYLHHLAAQLPRRDGHVLPGVQDLLEGLARRTDVAVGLLTGNTPEGAKVKLEYFRIDHHFPFGGYGHLHAERNLVAEAALEIARRRLDHPLTMDRVWVIGDTPRDIACARHIGARAVAVATGWHERDILARQEPDILLDDFRQAHDFLSWLGVGVA